MRSRGRKGLPVHVPEVPDVSWALSLVPIMPVAMEWKHLTRRGRIKMPAAVDLQVTEVTGVRKRTVCLPQIGMQRRHSHGQSKVTGALPPIFGICEHMDIDHFPAFRLFAACGAGPCAGDPADRRGASLTPGPHHSQYTTTHTPTQPRARPGTPAPPKGRSRRRVTTLHPFESEAQATLHR